jgi:hypothetical protein
MYETRIENAVKNLDGISKAEWDKDTKMIDKLAQNKKGTPGGYPF